MIKYGDFVIKNYKKIYLYVFYKNICLYLSCSCKKVHLYLV